MAGGTGTQQDPFLIETIQEFCTMQTGYNKLVKNVDFNDHSLYKDGIKQKVVEGSGIILDGNGKSIRNAVIMASDGSGCVFQIDEIRNANFPNMALEGAFSASTLSVFDTEFSRCSFGVSALKSDFTKFNTNTKEFSDCTFNIKGSPPTNTAFNFCVNLKRCHVNFDLTLSRYDGAFIKPYNATYESTYFTGALSAGAVATSGSSLAVFLNPYIKNCYCAMDITTNNSMYSSYSILLTAAPTLASGVSFGDVSRVTNLGTSTVRPGTQEPTIIWTTTEQIKTPGYLPSIGFPVIQG